MSFGSYMNGIDARHLSILDDIGMNQAIQMKLDSTHVIYHWDAHGLKPTAEYILRTTANQTTNMLELFLLGEVISKGPKLFKVGQVDMEMLIETDVTIPIEEYNQPFATIVIELPRDFCKNRNLDLIQAGRLLGGSELPEQHEPDFTIIHFNKELRNFIFALYFNTGIAIKTGFATSEGAIIEEMLSKERGRTFADSMETSKEEFELTNDLFRASINYCLLVDEIGVKKVGPYNPEMHRKLAKLKSKDQDHAKRALKSHPIVYELNQEVKLYRTVEHHSDLPGDSNREVHPHHRRGHYRMQAHGVGRALRKRIRIPPVFVNKHLFLGKLSDAKTTYTT